MAKKESHNTAAKNPNLQPESGIERETADMIISKSRTKNATGINVSGEFYGALDDAVRSLIKDAEERALRNNRRTLKAHDL